MLLFVALASLRRRSGQDADVVFFDTSFGLHGGVDEGAMVMALEKYLVKLQPGSFAVIVTVSQASR